MTPDPESRPLAPDVQADEVDLARYWRTLLRYWWLPAAGLVVGVFAGFATLIGASRPWEARAVVYLGQPYAPGGTSQILSLPSRFGFAGQLVFAESTVRTLAARLGVRPARLRASISTKPIAGLTQGRFERVAPLAEITVRNLPRAKAAAAANALAKLVARDFSAYVDQKLRTYRARQARAERELDTVNAELENARAQQQALIANRALPATEKLLLLANINNTLQFNEQRQANLEDTLLTLGDLIALAKQVERARVVEPATVTRAEPPSRRSSMIVGGVIGFLVGMLAAFVWEPLVARVRVRRA